MEYLFISEDGALSVETEITKTDRDALEGGYLKIVRFEKGKFEQLYEDGEWGVVA